MKKALFTIDVDPLLCYFDIHGLERPDVREDPLITMALPRLLRLLEQFHIRATLFVTLGTLKEKEQKVLADAAQSGHEIANHSLQHNYAMSTWQYDDIVKEISENAAKIQEIVGVYPAGFRAPGYSMNSTVYRALKESGVCYDASAFPSPFYYAAKWLLIRLKALRGKKSHSIISSFSEAFAKRQPFVEKESHLPVLPVSTVGLAGWPMLGTALLSFPSFFFFHLLNRALRGNYFHFEAHAIDMADHADSRLLHSLLPVQPDLKKSVAEKEALFTRLCSLVAQKGFTWVTASEYLKEWRRDACR